MRLSSIRFLWLFCLNLPFQAYPVAVQSGTSEDSLQTLLAEQPENPKLWFELGVLAMRSSQIPLSKNYFDEAIKLDGNSDNTKLRIGEFYMAEGHLREGLPYMMSSLSAMSAPKLEQLQVLLEKEKIISLQLLVLLELARREKGFLPSSKKAATIAYLLNDFKLCRSILEKHINQLDYESARNFFLVNLFLYKEPKVNDVEDLTKKFPHAEVAMLAHINLALAGKWKDVRSFLQREAKSPSFRNYYHLIKAMEALSRDRHLEAVDNYSKAMDKSWDRLKMVALAELYRLYNVTGNRFKSDQLWEDMKAQVQEPGLQEFLAFQLNIRNYEKQARYYFRAAIRNRPGSVLALINLWDDLMDNEEYETADQNLKVILERDPFSCHGNMLAMNYHQSRNKDADVLIYASNAARFCHDTPEPYLVLATTHLHQSNPIEAKFNIAKYLQKGGDINKVPFNLR